MLMFYLAMLDTPQQKSKFQMIYENYTGQILQTAHSLARNHMDAEDIAQDVFLKIINNIDTIQTENPLRLRALIIQMTKFASIDLLRKKKHKENPNDLINDWEQFPAVTTDIEECVFSHELINDYSGRSAHALKRVQRTGIAVQQSSAAVQPRPLGMG